MNTVARYKAAEKYFGEVAEGYEDRRTKRDRWEIEQGIVADYVRSLPKGSVVADVPIGTGRFIPFYLERGLKIVGADISPDMIAVARQKIENADGFQIEVAAAEKLPFADSSVDYLICHRYIKWLPDAAAFEVVMAEFARITRKQMFIQLKLEPERKSGFLRRVLSKFRKSVRSSDRKAAQTRYFTKEDSERIFERAGFKIERIAHHHEISNGIAYVTLSRKS